VNLVLLGRRTVALDAVAREATQLGAAVSVAEADLADAAATVRACREQLECQGTPEVIINNAGVIRREPVESVSVDIWDLQQAVNLRAPFLIVREVLPAMRTMRRGRIIHVGSISSTVGTAGAAAYCASKWGLVGFMKSIAEELRDSGVSTLAILPGSVDTEMLQGSGFSPRMSPEDVAQSIVHYALDAPHGHNGSVIEMFGV
jgi:3-oxoacyl-[acyl-carrier protein] reductase